MAYALFLGFVLYRNLSLKDLYELLLRNAVMLGIIILILSSAAVLGWLLTIEHIPETVAAFFTSLTDNKYLILLLINVFLILVGMLMDITASLIILGPILAPLAYKVGVHPLHFGIIMCVNLNIALITPPMGGCLFTAMIVGEVGFYAACARHLALHTGRTGRVVSSGVYSRTDHVCAAAAWIRLVGARGPPHTGKKILNIQANATPAAGRGDGESFNEMPFSLT